MAYSSTALAATLTAGVTTAVSQRNSRLPRKPMTTKEPSVDIRTRNQVTVFTVSSVGLQSHQGDEVFVRAAQPKMLIADEDE